MTGRYRTIVADPPWAYGGPGASAPGFVMKPTALVKTRGRERKGLPYESLPIADIADLPIRELAAPDAHLYLWTTNTHLEHAWGIARAWGFKPTITLVWCKKPRGSIGFPAFSICTEFVLFCRRGTLTTNRRIDRNWFDWPRCAHSAKPEAFLDIVEQVSPGPYLELFARRQRLGWDTWGNEALEHVTLGAARGDGPGTSDEDGRRA